MKKKKVAKKTKKQKPALRQSKSDNFLEYIRNNNSMIEYITALRVMNTPALKDPEGPRREGSFTRLAHAREEFALPVFTKGKSVTPPKRRPKPVSRRTPRKSG